MDPRPDLSAIESDELGWTGLLGALTELVGRRCAARVYPRGDERRLMELQGRFHHSFEPARGAGSGVDGGVMLLIGDGVIFLEPLQFGRALRELSPAVEGPGTTIEVEITMRSGAIVELDDAPV